MLMMILFLSRLGPILKKEIDLINHKYFYLSGTMMNNGQIEFDCGNNLKILMKKNF